MLQELIILLYRAFKSADVTSIRGNELVSALGDRGSDCFELTHATITHLLIAGAHYCVCAARE